MELQFGLAAAALGRLDVAVDSGVDLRRQRRLRVRRASARGTGRALTRRQAPEDLDQARAVVDTAAGEAERLGMVSAVSGRRRSGMVVCTLE